MRSPPPSWRTIAQTEAWLVVTDQGAILDIARPECYTAADAQMPVRLLCRRICSTVAMVVLRESDRFRAAPDDGEHRRAALRRHAVDAAVRPVVHVAGGHGTGFIAGGFLDEEDTARV